jgi:uncharacterized protein (TIGR04255 family)
MFAVNFATMANPTDQKRLRNSPLVHVLAQAQFSPVLDIADSLKAVQAGLRPLGFVKLQSGQFQQFQIQIQDGAPPKIESHPRWEFVNRDDTLSLVLSDTFVSLQTSRYSDFPDFSQTKMKVLDVLAKVTNISWIERIGLRYVNLVRPDASEAYRDYLRAELLGFPMEEVIAGPTPQANFATQAFAVTAIGTLVVRSYQLPSGQFVPPELQPNSLKYSERFQSAGNVAALDIDHFVQKGFEFTSAEVIAMLGALHDLAKSTFKRAVTAHALERWGPEELIENTASKT